MTKSEYAEKLKRPEWQRKRLEVFERDNWTCQACGRKDRTLHAHHELYIGEPWETPMEHIRTFCELCHDALGKHPRGGVTWSRHEDGGVGFKWTHCPLCGSEDLREKGSWDKCNNCGHAIWPERWPS